MQYFPLVPFHVFVALCAWAIYGWLYITTASGEGCTLSHEVSQDKMPVCTFFEQGLCTNDNCPYSHVRVNPNADLCPDFLKGYCKAGKACKLRHEMVGKKRKRDGKGDDGTSQSTNHNRRSSNYSLSSVSTSSSMASTLDGTAMGGKRKHESMEIQLRLALGTY